MCRVYHYYKSQQLVKSSLENALKNFDGERKIEFETVSEFQLKLNASLHKKF